ncbi:hypothetical protein H2248_000513 [Termitomyces sp. 'cryptogamus']|nr:hypothetical protein H2248_000513 [Termitomyces sp. 'cryptogamus']
MTSPLLVPVQIPTSHATTSFSTGSSSRQRSLSSMSLHAQTGVSRQLGHFPKNTVTIREEGLRHANIILEARQYKTPVFAQRLLECLRLLAVPFWSTPGIVPAEIKIQKVSGALTNAVFFVSYPSAHKSCTVLLRVYGVSSGCLVSRPRELHILHVLSSQYRIGPRVYGTFENGRLEEFFESTTLTSSDIRDPTISRWIGARMAELHSVDIEVVESGSTRGPKSDGWEIGVKGNVKQWLPPAQEVLSLPSVDERVREELNLTAFKREWTNYLRWLSTVDDIHSGSARVFAHNDTQYGNLLRLQYNKDIIDEHRQLIVVDFEYAAPNPASFDIANHFHEWTANYHAPNPHLLDTSRYPTYDERRNFYTAYIGHTAISGEVPILDDDERELQIQQLDQQVHYWSPASHAMWAIWGIVQAREDIESNNTEPEFDYIGYSVCRMTAFRKEIRALGIHS